MKYKVYNHKYESMIKNIKIYFSQVSESIYHGRNRLKIYTFSDKKFVIKSFKVPHIINRIAYTFLRDSKAKKSYINAIKISNFTPKPVGYVEYFNFGLLCNSYYVCESYDYDFTIREPLLDANYHHKEEIFKAFALFTFRLHNNNIVHLDYSPGNILIRNTDEGYIFKIVDINRMQFKILSHEERLKNFSKLWANDDDLALIIKFYSTEIGMNYDKAYSIALKASKMHKEKKNLKKILRGEVV